jgi:molybdopterin-guanine dinucleotide biosynthesis protein A
MTVNCRLAAVILAGGTARRMGGGDKPLLEVGGRSILRAIIEAVGLPDIAISANGDPARFAEFDCPVLPDGAFEGQGPLAGILAGLHWAAERGAEALLSVPGDMPFLPPGFAEQLLPAPRAAVAYNRQHHLLATWPIACNGTLRSGLESSQMRRVGDFASTISMQYVEFPVFSQASFANINTQKQLELARRFASSTGWKPSPSGDDWGDFDA